MTRKARTVEAYFPAGLWYPLSWIKAKEGNNATGEEQEQEQQQREGQGGFVVGEENNADTPGLPFVSMFVDSSALGRKVMLPAPLTEINVHVRGGSILPLQRPAMTTTVSRTTPFTLLVSLSSASITASTASTTASASAFGSLFWDDGEQVTLEHFLKMEYHASVFSSSTSFNNTTAGGGGGDGGMVSGAVVTDTYPAASSLSVSSLVIRGPSLRCADLVPAATLFTLNNHKYTGPTPQCSVDRHVHVDTDVDVDVKSNGNNNSNKNVKYSQLLFPGFNMPLNAPFVLQWKSILGASAQE